MIKKITDILLDATVGLLNQYQRKSVELAKLVATASFTQGIKIVRKHSLFLFLLIFCMMMLSVTLIATPIALVALAPWPARTKMLAVLALGLFYVLIAIVFIQRLFSEKTWMRFSGASEHKS